MKQVSRVIIFSHILTCSENVKNVGRLEMFTDFGWVKIFKKVEWQCRKQEAASCTRLKNRVRASPLMVNRVTQILRQKLKQKQELAFRSNLEIKEWCKKCVFYQILPKWADGFLISWNPSNLEGVIVERQTMAEQQKCINSCWKGISRKGPSIVNTFIWRQWQCLTLVLVLVLVLVLALNNTNEYFETVGFLAPSQCGALQC